ncbi:hypothetical protein [Rhizobacter sp. Root1221]|uniref:hypothetical protein n=1 Tax=Rhizobacter sp. Root1221 TaxID=1736433 RepID=UPI0006F8E2FD|nr:hypothetical protein [Rhizobacter sp. Root1221]KQV78798.1 hypothetical protein ASC87_10695 [Rhizobacter sp. Root1221]
MAAVAHAPVPARLRSGAPAILDIEASGFGRASYPIEVGYILGDGTSFCTLIRPAPTWTHWDTSAESVHHIPRATLDRHGRSVAEVAATLNERLRGQTLFSDGWGHDYPWLSALFEEAGCVPLFRLDSLRKLLSEDEATRWQRTRDRISGEFSLARHRASTDAWLLQQTWLRVQEEAGAD